MSVETREAKAKAKSAKAEAKALRPWYKKPFVVGPLALVAIFAIAVASGGGDETATESVVDAGVGAVPDASDDTDTPAEESEGTEEAEVVEVGEAARDGKFEFTVTSFECGVQSVGEDFLTEEPQGEFCLLGVTVTNIGEQAQMLFSDNQYLFDTEGRQFSADSMATISHDVGGDAFFTEINPGNSISGEVVFDVPVGANIVEARLHDSAFSGGVVVPLN
jgi:hypothetical protein